MARAPSACHAPKRSEADLNTVSGNIRGLKAAQHHALEVLYQRRVDRKELISPALARELTEISRETGRRVGILLDRNGKVDGVILGDATRVFLPDLGKRRAGAARFRGVRLVLTGFRPDGLTEDELTDLTLLQLDAIALIRVGNDGLPGAVEYAHLLPPGQEGEKVWRVEKRRDVHHWDLDFGRFIADLEGQFTRTGHLRETTGGDGVILVGLTLNDPVRAKRGMAELARLADTAGLKVLDQTIQPRKAIDGRTVVGSGKLQELLIRAMHLGADALIFDRELSPSQLRNIATETELKVLDRTQLILDIFAQHASTKEGRLQVELAQLRYLMPRLAIMPTAMSRLTGGVGGRGPGETKLEINKRRAEERKKRMEDELDRLAQGRVTRRARRTKAELPVVAIVGYTNAGKSTLLNRLTHSAVLVEDKLFATLDTTTRRFRFPEQREIVVSDTVGFIEDLPATLVAAFKSTLEELDEADLLLHVLDASDPEVESHRLAVETTLKDLDLTDKPVLLVWNKADAADPEVVAALVERHGGLAISAITGQNADRLLDRIERAMFRGRMADLNARDESSWAG